MQVNLGRDDGSQTTSNAAPAAGPAGSAARFGRGPTLLALGAAALLAVLDGTVVAVALAPLADALHSSLSAVVWATVGYLLAAAATLPALGWATARFGGRRVFLAGLLLFVVGSALVATSWSVGALIAFRVVQGVGGGLLEPTSLMLVARLARADDVGRVMGRMSMIINIAPVAGPLVGGALLATGHWQWIFVVNIPFGLAVLAAALAFVPADEPSRTERPPSADVRGLGLLTVGFVAGLFAVNRGGQDGVGPSVVVAGVVGLALLASYVRYALTTTRTPALDPRLLRRSGFAGALGVMACVGLIMFSQLTSLPVEAAARYALGGVTTGVLVCALGAGLVVSMTAGGRVSDRTGPRPLVRVGGLGTATGLAAYALLHDHLPLAGAAGLFVAVGLCFGFVAAPSFSSVYRTLPPAEQPQGTTALFMTVQFTASLGVLLLGVLQHQVPHAWVSVLFAIIAAAALVASLTGRWLPGRPGGR